MRNVQDIVELEYVQYKNQVPHLLIRGYLTQPHQPVGHGHVLYWKKLGLGNAWLIGILSLNYKLFLCLKVVTEVLSQKQIE